MTNHRSIFGRFALTALFSVSVAFASTEEIRESSDHRVSISTTTLAPYQLAVQKQPYMGRGDYIYLDGTTNGSRTFKRIDERQRARRNKEETISGTIVGYDNGLVLSDGSCVQNVLVRTPEKNAATGGFRYVVLSHRYSCENRLPNKLFLGPHPQLRVSAVRDPGCNADLDFLMFVTQVGPEGNMSKLPLMRFIDESEIAKVPGNVELPCYILKRIKPSRRHRAFNHTGERTGTQDGARRLE
jgi:hypothetical protein